MAARTHAWPPRLLQATPTCAPLAPPFRREHPLQPFRRSEAPKVSHRCPRQHVTHSGTLVLLRLRAQGKQALPAHDSAAPRHC
eukprot:8756269-Alexandrium_andersonii.AAC.1